jgi:hypothetical protein
MAVSPEICGIFAYFGEEGGGGGGSFAGPKKKRGMKSEDVIPLVQSVWRAFSAI